MKKASEEENSEAKGKDALLFRVWGHWFLFAGNLDDLDGVGVGRLRGDAHRDKDRAGEGDYGEEGESHATKGAKKTVIEFLMAGLHEFVFHGFSPFECFFIPPFL